MFFALELEDLRGVYFYKVKIEGWVFEFLGRLMVCCSVGGVTLVSGFVPLFFKRISEPLSVREALLKEGIRPLSTDLKSSEDGDLWSMKVASVSSYKFPSNFSTSVEIEQAKIICADLMTIRWGDKDWDSGLGMARDYCSVPVN